MSHYCCSRCHQRYDACFCSAVKLLDKIQQSKSPTLRDNMKIERLTESSDSYTLPDKLITGEFYECMRSTGSFYNGWILFVTNIESTTGKVYGSWINQGSSIFALITPNSSDFRFKKLNMKLVEVKE